MVLVLPLRSADDQRPQRAVRDFNPAGWTAHSLRMAEVLKLNPDALGTVGAGWFYDPALEEVTPSLAYIRRTQVQFGASCPFAILGNDLM